MKKLLLFICLFILCSCSSEVQHEHNFTIVETIDATCTLEGHIVKQCECGEIIDELIAATGHDYEIIKHEPNCTESGEIIYTCKTCGYSYIEIIEPLGHDYKNDICSRCGYNCGDCSTGQHGAIIVIEKPATCTEAGQRSYKCADCNKVLSTEVLKATGHKSSEQIIDTKATCEHEGHANTQCIVCNELLETIVLPKLDHTVSKWIIDKQPTCTEKGHQYKQCTTCKKVMETADIDITDHNWDYIIDKQPTCTETGVAHWECLDCHVKEDSETLAKVSHTKSAWITDTPATCIETGAAHTECTVCHTILETKVLNKTSHSYSYVIDTPASCELSGIKHKECTVCHYKLADEIIKATGHHYVSYECTVCHKNIFDSSWSAGLDIRGDTVYGIGTCTTSVIHIPSYNGSGQAITKIAANAFKDTKITTIVLPSTITEIGDYAFTGCLKLNGIKLSTSIRKIGKAAFLSVGGTIISNTVIWYEGTSYNWSKILVDDDWRLGYCGKVSCSDGTAIN